jgi:pSer/pThr/pTyr-binding forkhead associated (FHA) protein
MLNATLTNSLILGRADPSAQTNADIDLGPHGAYQFGISRRHAMIRLRQQQLELLDLGSRNGTYLNGHKLSAHHPTVITDNDEIRLGKFVIRLNIVPAKA